MKNAGVTPILDLPTVGENLAGSFAFSSAHRVAKLESIDHVHGWANAFTNAS